MNNKHHARLSVFRVQPVVRCLPIALVVLFASTALFASHAARLV